MGKLRQARDDPAEWAALRMIRETVEQVCPPGVLPSEEAVLQLYGPEPMHEGQAISDAIVRAADIWRSRFHSSE
jgi:hypothetical protein